MIKIASNYFGSPIVITIAHYILFLLSSFSVTYGRRLSSVNFLKFYHFKSTLEVVNERCLLLYSSRIYIKHLQLNSIIGSSPCLNNYTKYIRTLVFESYALCLRSKFLKATLRCYDGSVVFLCVFFLGGDRFHVSRIIYLILSTTICLKI